MQANQPPPSDKDAADVYHRDAGPTIKPLPEITDEVKARNKPSGTHYFEPSPLGIEPVEQTGVDKLTNPPRSSEPARHSAEVPLGTGDHAEPPGGGGRETQRKDA